MPAAHSLIESAPMLARVSGTLVVLGIVVLAAALTGYSIYWLIFKMGKD